MDIQDTGLKHEKITESGIGCAFEVIKELGAGSLESVSENALLMALRQKGLSAISQHPVKDMFRGECAGDFYADIIVAEKVIIELKDIKLIAPEYQAQIINYWLYWDLCENVEFSGYISSFPQWNKIAIRKFSKFLNPLADDFTS